MKFSKMIEAEFDVKKLSCIIGVRYWEDADVNGVREKDEDPTIPCRIDGNWCPIIDIESGVILNWEHGVTASTHFKVCDDGIYKLLDGSDALIAEIDGYVPKIMCPEGEGYGDYVIMKIDENGKIANWKPDLKSFK